MEQHSTNPLIFGPASAADLPSALQLLFGSVEETGRKTQIAMALLEIQNSDNDGEKVLIGRRGDDLAAVIWLQIRPGRVASMWPPGVATGEPDSTVKTLIDLAIATAAAKGMRLVQTLLETDAGPQAACLRQCAFQHIADLLYLVSLFEEFPTASPSTDLVFEPIGTGGEIEISETRLRRLIGIIERTYIDTLDCPSVHGLRSVNDVLATYRAVGKYNPAKWFFVRHCDADIGCLLLADHPPEHNCELIYMGVVPEARGNARGVEMVRYAQWLVEHSDNDDKNGLENCGETAELPAKKLVLAVDAANSPAISVYAAAGFQTWDRRSVFLREIAENF
ncbi:MAG TPA: GNAT family N-acetyltransferase [Pirellulales bacterium]